VKAHPGNYTDRDETLEPGYFTVYENDDLRHKRDFGLITIFTIFVMFASYSVVYACKRLNRVGVNANARI
jgi:hypothetical protein